MLPVTYQFTNLHLKHLVAMSLAETSLVSSCFVILPNDILAKDTLSLIDRNKFVLFFSKLTSPLALGTWFNGLSVIYTVTQKVKFSQP